MNLEDFRLLYDYNSWANHRTLDACAALSDEQFTRDLNPVSVPCATRSFTFFRPNGSGSSAGTAVRPPFSRMRQIIPTRIGAELLGQN